MVDVIANDYDFNNDVLDVELLDTVSFLGGTVSLSEGTGPGGRNQIVYTPPAGGGDGDFFHYTVVDSTGRTDFGAVNVSSAFLGVDTSLDFYSYDPGTGESPVFSNATTQAIRLTPQTTGDVSWSAPVQAVDRGASAGNAYNRDLIFGSDTTTWSHTIENGRWRVVVNMSDPSTNLDNMFVNAEGQSGLSDLDRPIGTNTTVSFEVDVLDGELNLEFGDADTVNSLWAVNRINLEQLEAFVSPLLEGDYNNDGVVNAADYTVYRDAFGQTVAAPYDGADGNGDRQVDAADRVVWAANYGAESVTIPLITATQGNGEFALDNEEDASLTGGGTGSGQTGQAFVNSGAADVISDPIVRAFTAGETLSLSYLLGSDTGGATASVESTVSFVFDAGLASESTVTLPTRSATGLTTPAITEELTVPADASSLSVTFLIDGVEVGERSLLDGVFLNVTTTSTLAASASSSISTLAVSDASETIDDGPDATEPAAHVESRDRFGAVPVRQGFVSSIRTSAARESAFVEQVDQDRLNLLLFDSSGLGVEDGLAVSLTISQEEPTDAAFESFEESLQSDSF